MHTTYSSAAAAALRQPALTNACARNRGPAAVRVRQRRLRSGLLALLCTLFALGVGSARADGIKVNDASAQLVNGVVMVSAHMTYHLSDKAVEALVNGVPLTFNVNVEIQRHRKWLWNKTVVSVRQSYRLEYHALSKQYLVINLITGVHRTFQTLQDAEDGLGTISHLPVGESRQLAKAGDYLGRIQAQLDIEALPSPLSPIAWLSNDWRLSSDWYTWKLDL